MTIYTSASRTTKPQYDICSGGVARTNELLDRLGIYKETLVPMRLILDEMGISDCTFSFCEVRKGDEAEAQEVMGKYMAYLLDLTNEYFGIYLPSKALMKRIEGHIRPEALADQYKAVKDMQAFTGNIGDRRALEVYLCLLSAKPTYQAVTHAGISLMDAAYIIGKREEVHGKLKEKLRELLGPSTTIPDHRG